MFKSLIKSILPPIFTKLYLSSWLNVKHQGGFFGRFNSWEMAKNKSKGYDSNHILEQVFSATQEAQVLPGAFERDGILIQKRDYSYPTLAYLARWAIDKQDLSVLDIGGSLGSVYYQFKKLYPRLNNISWSVIEQPHFVAKGKEFFSSDELYFYDSVSSAMKKTKPSVLLLSGMLQYVSDPFLLLEELNQSEVEYLIIDRIPTSIKSFDQITVQYVPKHIYEGSYPAWIFSKKKLLETLLKSYSLIHEFATLDGHAYFGMQQVEFRGFILERKP
jgi:putative methyltransferase (TIGR04325 family)